MRCTERRIPSQYAAKVFVCTLALVICLPAVCDAEPCEEVKSPQQSTSVKIKQEVSGSEAAKAKSIKPNEVVSESDKPIKVIAEPEKAEVKTEDAEQAKSEKIGVKSEQVVVIDMEILTSRLKKTKAIGLFTKLAIRNDVSDLMNDVKRYRKKSMLAARIKEIRESFEGLLMKIIALLDDDPELSRAMYVGRESIWKSLLEVKV
jgi:hypothetical protein